MRAYVGDNVYTVHTLGWTTPESEKPPKPKKPSYKQLLATLQQVLGQEDITPWLVPEEAK